MAQLYPAISLIHTAPLLLLLPPPPPLHRLMHTHTHTRSDACQSSSQEWQTAPLTTPWTRNSNSLLLVAFLAPPAVSSVAICSVPSVHPAVSPLSFFCLSLSLLFPSPAPLSFSLCSPFQHCLSLTLLLPLSLSPSLFWMCSSPAESLSVSSSLFSCSAFQEPGTSLGGGDGGGGALGGGMLGVCQGGFSQPTLMLPRTAVAFHWKIRAWRGCCLVQTGARKVTASWPFLYCSFPLGDQPRGHGQHRQSCKSSTHSQKKDIRLLKGQSCTHKHYHILGTELILIMVTDAKLVIIY